MSTKKKIVLCVLAVVVIALAALLAKNIVENVRIDDGTVIDLVAVRWSITSDETHEYTAKLNRLTNEFTFSVKDLATGEVVSSTVDADEVGDYTAEPTSLPDGLN